MERNRLRTPSERERDSKVCRLTWEEGNVIMDSNAASIQNGFNINPRPCAREQILDCSGIKEFMGV